MTVILIVLLILLLLYYFATFLLAGLGMHMMRKMWKNGMDANADMQDVHDDRSHNGRSQTAPNSQGSQTQKHIEDDEGTYIDFEEEA